MMNGSISVTSTPGKGSCFEIILYKVKVVTTTPQIKINQDFNLHNIQFEKTCVLVVDDIESNRNLIKEYLQQVNLVVIVVQIC